MFDDDLMASLDEAGISAVDLTCISGEAVISPAMFTLALNTFTELAPNLKLDDTLILDLDTSFEIVETPMQGGLLQRSVTPGSSRSWLAEVNVVPLYHWRY